MQFVFRCRTRETKEDIAREVCSTRLPTALHLCKKEQELYLCYKNSSKVKVKPVTFTLLFKNINCYLKNHRKLRFSNMVTMFT